MGVNMSLYAYSWPTQNSIRAYETVTSRINHNKRKRVNFITELKVTLQLSTYYFLPNPELYLNSFIIHQPYNFFLVTSTTILINDLPWVLIIRWNAKQTQFIRLVIILISVCVMLIVAFISGIALKNCIC